MVFVIAMIGVVLVLCIVSAAQSAKYGTGKSVKVQFRDSETGRTVHAGNGTSIGGAISDGFSKMCYSVSISSREDTIKSKLDTMNRTLSENRSRMRQSDIAICEQYISRMSGLLSQKQAQRQQMEREKRDADQQKKLQRVEKEKRLSQHQKYIAQQRRLLSDSLRYDVLRRDGFRCQICGATQKDGVKLHVDHIFPVSKGGRTEMSNLRTLCERCNMGKRDKIEVVKEKP